MKMDGGKAILPNVIRAVEIAKQRGILVVWVISLVPILFL